MPMAIFSLFILYKLFCAYGFWKEHDLKVFGDSFDLQNQVSEKSSELVTMWFQIKLWRLLLGKLYLGEFWLFV